MQIETNKVRVISNTTGETPKANLMIGGEYKVGNSNYSNNIVVIDGGMEDAFLFNKSDVRFLTPIQFNDRYIAIGDWVKQEDDWYKVVSFAPGENALLLVVESKNKLFYDLIDQEQIQGHDTRIKTDDKTEEAINLLKEKGYKIIKNN